MGLLNGHSAGSNCVTNYGNVLRMKIIERQYLTLTPAAGGEDSYEACVVEVGEGFKGYDFYESTAYHKETKVSGRVKKWQQEFGFHFGMRNQAVRDEVLALAGCGCGVVIAYEDNNGKIWIVEGDNNKGIFLTENEALTGEGNDEDISNETVVLTAKTSTKAKIYTGTWASLTEL